MAGLNSLASGSNCSVNSPEAAAQGWQSLCSFRAVSRDSVLEEVRGGRFVKPWSVHLIARTVVNQGQADGSRQYFCDGAAALQTRWLLQMLRSSRLLLSSVFCFYSVAFNPLKLRTNIFECWTGAIEEACLGSQLFRLVSSCLGVHVQTLQEHRAHGHTAGGGRKDVGNFWRWCLLQIRESSFLKLCKL